MEKQEKQQSPQGLSPRLNKKVLIIGGVIAVLVLLISALFLMETNSNSGTLPPNPSLSPSQTAVNPSGTVNPRFNPLINNKEVERVESSLRKKMESAGISISPKPEYKFQYKLDPGLKDKSSFKFIEPVLGCQYLQHPLCPVNSPHLQPQRPPHNCRCQGGCLNL